MLTYRQLLMESDLIILEKDEKGKIVRPVDKEDLKKCIDILNNSININNELYNKSDDKWYLCREKKILDPKTNKLHTVTYITDITYYKEKERTSQLDYLTKLTNRALTNELVNEYIKYAIDKKEEFSFIMCDLDNFKQANDYYGHLFGDEILKEVATILQKNIKEQKNDINKENIVGRFGGDEFVILLKHQTIENTMEKMNNIKDQIDNLEIIKNRNDIEMPTISVGIYFVEESDLLSIDNIDDFRSKMYKKADQALYYSKNLGKNKITVYDNNISNEKIKIKK